MTVQIPAGLLAGTNEPGNVTPPAQPAVPRGPDAQARIRQLVERGNAIARERDQLLGRLQEQERQLQQRQAQQDPLEGLRQLLAPKEPEPADPLERDVLGMKKQFTEMQSKLEAQIAAQQAREQAETTRAYQSNVDQALTSAIGAVPGLSNGARQMVYDAMLTKLVAFAEQGRPVTGETIRSLVNHYTGQFAPPARPIVNVQNPQGAVGERAPAVQLMQGSQTAMGTGRTAPRNPGEAREQVNRMLEQWQARG